MKISSFYEASNYNFKSYSPGARRTTEWDGRYLVNNLSVAMRLPHFEAFLLSTMRARLAPVIFSYYRKSGKFRCKNIFVVAGGYEN